MQLRSSEALQEAVDHLRKGTIGKVYMSRGLVLSLAPVDRQEGPRARCPRTWTGISGRARRRSGSSRDAIVHYNWHWHWDYGNGDVGNQGIHETDMCMWGLGVTVCPTKVTSMGGKFLFDDDKETPGDS